MIFGHRNAIETVDLRKTYYKRAIRKKARREIRALDGLDLELPAGAVTGFLGPNGAGKTTMFRSLLGLTRFDSGDVRVLGHTVPDQLSDVVKKVGAIIEEPGLARVLTGRVNLRIAAHQLGYGHHQVDEMLEFVGLTADADRKVKGYSKGMRQRLALAAALIGDPDLLLLDEPLDGLDPAGQNMFRARLRTLADEGCTIVISSHVLADIEAFADYVIMIDKGRLITHGPIEELLVGEATRVTVESDDAAISALAAHGIEASSSGTGLVVNSTDASTVVQVLGAAGIYPTEVSTERVSLESFFLDMTGANSAEEEAP